MDAFEVDVARAIVLRFGCLEAVIRAWYRSLVANTRLEARQSRTWSIYIGGTGRRIVADGRIICEDVPW